jgi:beta-1,4-mannosyltransferase
MFYWLLKAAAILFPVFLILIIVLLPDGAYGTENARLRRKGDIHSLNRTAILVLGDIGRSPRMQNHAISMLRGPVAVDLIGYVESELHPRLLGQDHLKVHPIAKSPVLLGGSGTLAWIVNAPLKVFWQIWELWMILGHQTKPAKWLLIQVGTALSAHSPRANSGRTLLRYQFSSSRW